MIFVKTEPGLGGSPGADSCRRGRPTKAWRRYWRKAPASQKVPTRPTLPGPTTGMISTLAESFRTATVF